MRSQACEMRATSEAGRSRSFSRAKRAALWARVRKRYVLVAQSSFSISINLGNLYYDTNGACEGYTLVANVQGDAPVAGELEMAAAT